jgi:hypothetical protein
MVERRGRRGARVGSQPRCSVPKGQAVIHSSKLSLTYWIELVLRALGYSKRIEPLVTRRAAQTVSLALRVCLFEVLFHA